MAGVELESHARVRRLELRVEQQRAGHPQVDQQEAIPRKRPDEVLTGAADLLDGPAAQLGRDLGRAVGAGPAPIQDLHPLDLAPLQMGRKLAADRLYLGQLWHRTDIGIRL